jgi:hypothetical protein
MKRSVQDELRVEVESVREGLRSESEHQNHRIVVVDGPDGFKVLPWLGRSIAGGGMDAKGLSFQPAFGAVSLIDVGKLK